MVVELFQGDCLELMKNIPDGSMDMVLADPPYGMTQNEWDKIIPFEPLWEQYRRICKQNAAILLFGQQPFISDVVSSNRKNFKYCWVWSKGQCSGFLNAKKQPLRNCEEIAVFYQKQCTYNPQMRKGKPQIKSTGGATTNYGKFEYRPHVSEDYYPTQILNFSLPKFKSGHPTQKPVALLEYLIRTYTNEGDTVLDNCMGSGSTGVACVNTGRNFIGMELDSGYFEAAKRRINEAQYGATAG